MNVVELQRQLPNARVVYVSATNASELHHMAYMERLGLWGVGSPFPDVRDFLHRIAVHGISAMEMLSLDLKFRGVFLSRTLSFAGAEFEIVERPLSIEAERQYNEYVQLWSELRKLFESAMATVRNAGLTRELKRKRPMTLFWGAHQSFFRQVGGGVLRFFPSAILSTPPPSPTTRWCWQPRCRTLWHWREPRSRTGTAW